MNHFGHPLFLILLAFLPLLWAYSAFTRARREKALALIAPGRHAAAWSGVQELLVFLGLGLCLFAAAEPRWGRETVAFSSVSRNVVVALDVSRSMLAGDLHPSRLERAKSDVADLIDSLDAVTDDGKRVSDRCALVVFRSTAKVVSPLTDDRTLLKRKLSLVSCDDAEPGETQLAAGIRSALSLLEEDDEGRTHYGAVILVSDGGEESERKAAVAEAARAKACGVPVFTIGIGDPEKATAIRLPQDALSGLSGLNGGYLTDERGEKVLVKLDAETLQAVAAESGGRYLPFATPQAAQTSLGVAYRDFLRQVAAKEEARAYERMTERFQWFLVPGLVMLLAGAALSHGRFRRNIQRR